ncbi:hypothetical protein TOPH_06318 [Tolypocladium ophioglossoides CBS 100239]|uniref:Uncharacterized protein n=1 Tax=Tolypocladium ophioglossoides (strain CBS 100239) TaxID=1163406 RepID=A0A0L0N5E9_TOLOC|nr:hypothetical protein TOPH_06318 [Tolypocladium ophioglossoides CBS 100239]
MATPPPTPEATGDPNDTIYCVEVEFMVAKERTGQTYNNDSPQQTRWACPASARSPCSEVLYECGNVLTRNKESFVVVREKEREPSDPLRGAYAPQSWLVQPSGHVAPRDGCPSEYDWVGIKIRSPMLPESELIGDESTVKRCIDALRAAVRIHVNSSCQFNVFVQPTGCHMGLTQAKRLVTLVWLTEAGMLLPLCSRAESHASGRAIPLTAHSTILAFPIKGVKKTRPRDPLVTAIMDQNLPRFHNDMTQERMHRIWSYTDVSKVARAICDTRGRPSALSLDTYYDQNTDVENPALLSVAGFRYAMWHPYDGLDVSNYWIQLVMALFRASQFDSKRFRNLVQSIDEVNWSFCKSGADENEQRRVLMDELGLTEAWYEPWGKIVEEYRPGGKLSPEVINKQPPLA